MDERILKIKNMLSVYGLEPSDETAGKLLLYYEMLVEKNKVMNLTAITDFDDVLLKHFSDSISVISSFPELKTKLVSGNEVSFVDIGTGAGFPGIPLKIVFPNTDAVLMDSLGKRVTFLSEVIEKLGLKKIKAVNMRAEEAGASEIFREKFDYCFCRAVAKLNIISEYAIPLVKQGGFFIPYKSGEIDEERRESENAIAKLGGKLEDIKYMELPGSDIKRAHVIIKKIRKTEKQFPRSNAKIKKAPL